MSEIEPNGNGAVENDDYKIIAEAVEVVPIDSIFEDPANSRLHPERNIRSLMASLQRWGQQKPIVVTPKNIIVAGNGTHRAMKAMGFETIAIVRSDLEGPEATAFGIADNQIALIAEWDFQALSEHVKSLSDWENGFDFQTIGFEAHEIDPMIHADWTPPDVKKTTDDDGPVMGDPIKCTVEQREVIDRAIAVVRRKEGDASMSEGRCCELICSNFVHGGEIEQVYGEGEGVEN